MASGSFKVSFTLDESDAKYFRNLFRTARQHASEADGPRIVREVRKALRKVREADSLPPFVEQAVGTLDELIELVEDEDYRLPKPAARDAIGALAYFAHPQDVIPDHIPGVGFLDDALMMKFVAEDFKHEIWAHRKFKAFRGIAGKRTSSQLANQRKSLRDKVREKSEADAARGGGRAFFLGRGPAAPVRVAFTIAEKDALYFRKLFRSFRKQADAAEEPRILKAVKKLVERVKATPRVPGFVQEAIRTLEDIVEMIEDGDYELPRRVGQAAAASLAYFANPQDVIPDHVPGIGFLDDAIVMKFVEEQFKHEIWAYRKFRSFREGAEHRPWTAVAQERLPRRLVEYRKSLRAKVQERTQADVARKRGQAASGRGFGW